MRFLVLAAALVLAGSAAAKPNIVFVSVDTLRADALGVYGAPNNPSPFLDGLARRGLLFETAVTPMPSTTPSHASMLTSVLPWRHGSIGNAVPMNGSRETLARALQRAGYRTTASVAVPIIGTEYGFASGFDSFDEPRADVVRRPASEVSADAKRRIDEHVASRSAQPLFLFVHYYDVHYPYRSWVSPEEAKFEPLEQQNDMARQRPRYADGVRHVDAAIADLYKHLERRGLAENLVISVTADHGEQLGDHGVFVNHKDLYRETVRVPLLLAGVGIPRGRVTSAVSTMDIGVSLLALAGTRYAQTVDGIDLLAVARRNPRRSTRPLIAAGNSGYTMSLLLIDGSLWYIRNFDHLYRRASVVSPAPSGKLGRTWNEAPFHEAKDGAATYRVPFLAYEPYLVMIDHVARRPDCEASINLLAVPGGTYFSSPKTFRGSVRLTAASARYDALTVTVTPAECAGSTVYSVSRYEGPPGPAAVPTRFEETVVNRRLSTVDELYDVSSDPAMLRNLLQGPAPRALQAKLRTIFGRATASQRDRYAAHRHTDEEKKKLKSLGYIH